MHQLDEAPDPRLITRATAGKLVALVAVLLLLVIGGRSLASLVPRFVELVKGLGGWAPIVFIAGYVIATVAFIPGSLLTLAAGAIFGLAGGTAVVRAGATLGSLAAFLIARHFARHAVERRLAGNERFRRLDGSIANAGLKIVFLLRLSPAVPYNVLNYALGLTKIPVRDYVIASVGMLPATFLYVYYGKLAGDVAAAAAGQPPRDPAYWVVLGAGLAATIAVTVIVTRIAARALRRYE